MGMYTELHYNAALREDTPEKVISILKYMTGEEAGHYGEPEHELFNCARWEVMLQCDSFYFDAITKSSVTFNTTSEHYYLNIVCNLKDYNNEILEFIDWVDQYTDKVVDDFLGFYRYEEDEVPTLIYKRQI